MQKNLTLLQMTVTKTLAGDYITSTKCLTAHEVRVGGGFTISAPHVFHEDKDETHMFNKFKDVRMVPKQLVFSTPSKNSTEVYDGDVSKGVPKMADRDSPNVPTTYTLNGDILVHGVGIKEESGKIVLVTDGSAGTSMDIPAQSILTTIDPAQLTYTDTTTSVSHPITIDLDGATSTHSPSASIVTVGFLKELLKKGTSTQDIADLLPSPTPLRFMLGNVFVFIRLMFGTIFF